MFSIWLHTIGIHKIIQMIQTTERNYNYNNCNVYMDMVTHSIKECTVFNDKKFIKKYITNVLGLEMQKQPRFTSGKKLTVSDFATWYNSGTYIITIANHLTVVKDDTILDTWNCENKCVGNYWRV